MEKTPLTGFADVGYAVGDQHDCTGTIGIHRRQPQVQAGIQVGAIARLRGQECLAVPVHGIRGHADKSGRQFPGVLVEQHDAEAVFGSHFLQGALHAVDQRRILALHGSGYVHDKHPVPALHDRLEVVSGRHHQHEGAAAIAFCFVRNEVHAGG